MKRLIITLALMAIALTAHAQWFVLDDVDPMTDERKLSFVYRGDDFPGEMLVIRKAQYGLEIFVAWGEYFADGEHPVTVRFDKRAPVNMTTSLSTNNTATFFLIPEYILTMLLESDTVIFRATPYNEGPKTFIVPCAEFRDLVKPHLEYLDVPVEG